MRFRDFTLFGFRLVFFPANLPFVVLADDGEEYIHSYTDTDDVEFDGILYAALYGETLND